MKEEFTDGELKAALRLISQKYGLTKTWVNIASALQATLTRMTAERDAALIDNPARQELAKVKAERNQLRAEVERLKGREQAWKKWRRSVVWKGPQGNGQLSELYDVINAGPDFGGDNVVPSEAKIVAVAERQPETSQVVTEEKPLSERMRAEGERRIVSHESESSMWQAIAVQNALKRDNLRTQLEASKKEIELRDSVIRCQRLTMAEYQRIDRENVALREQVEAWQGWLQSAP